MSKWYEIKAQAEDGPAQVYLFGEVGESVFGESKSALAFIDELKGLGDRDVDLHINSLGGDVFDGQAIFTALRHHKGAVTTYIDGVAASIAALVALVG